MSKKLNLKLHKENNKLFLTPSYLFWFRTEINFKSKNISVIHYIKDKISLINISLIGIVLITNSFHKELIINNMVQMKSIKIFIEMIR